MTNLLKQLAGRDRRSIGASNRVAAQVLAHPRLFRSVFAGLLDDDPVLRMRCADAVEKVTAQRPDLLLPYKRQLLDRIALVTQPEVRWHVAQMLPRLDLTRLERTRALAILHEYTGDESRIVKTCAMQALADFAEQDQGLRAPVLRQLRRLTHTGSPAMQSRGRKLIARLSHTGRQ